MKAVVLAGGFGTRLASVLKGIPKPMAMVGNKPFLALLLDSLGAQGVTEVVLAVHYLKDQILTYFGDSYQGMRIRYSEEIEPLGTGGGLVQALEGYPEFEPILCLNGDSFLEMTFQDLIQKYLTESLDLIIALRKVDSCHRYGTVHIDANRVTHFQYPGPSSPGLISAGVYVLSKYLFTKLGLGGSFSFEREILEKNLPLIKCGYSLVDGNFIDIGVPHTYKRSKNFFKKNLLESTGK